MGLPLNQLLTLRAKEVQEACQGCNPRASKFERSVEFERIFTAADDRKESTMHRNTTLIRFSETRCIVGADA
jgi:hypothetical protein